MSELKPKSSYYIVKRCELCNVEFESLIKRQQRFCSGKCSSKFTGKDSDRIDKIKKTKLEKYGSETYVNSEKAKNTCLEKYGVDNASKTDDVIRKIKNSNKKKFGVEWSFQSDVVKNKIKSTNLRKYGVESASQSPIIRNRVNKTVLKKYGVDNVFKNEEIKSKIYNTNLKKYGTKIPVNSEELKLKVSQKNKISTWEKLKQNPKINESVSICFDVNEYVNTDRTNLYKFKCNKCNTIFEDHIDGGHIPRCLICKPYIRGTSIMEKEIYDYIKSILTDSVEIQTKVRGIISGELDIFIPAKNVAIEFNGIYWHSELSGKKPKSYHLKKTEECLSKNIRLIHIFEDEWEKKESIVKSRLSNILNVGGSNKIYARNCEVREIDNHNCELFLETNHIQGTCRSPIRLALFEGEKIVSVMTFGKLRNVLGNTSKSDEYEMYRFCSNKTVVGGASKLLNYFIKTYNPKKITSYSDRRWSNGDVYKKMGFVLESNTSPNYFYIKYGYCDRINRYGFVKHNLFDKLEKFDNNLTEWQNMQLNGYDRIWDCGHGKWIMTR